MKIRTSKRKLVRAHVVVVDLRPLSSCTLLIEVDLSGCPCLSDLSPLAACVRVKSLKLSDETCVSDLSPLSGLVELTSLHLGSPYLPPVDVLAAACTRLTDLQLTRTLLTRLPCRAHRGS